MARLTTGMDLGPVIDASAKWVKDCLIDDRSLLSSENLWTPEMVAEVRAAFVDHPDTGADDFRTKLIGQMKPASQGAQQLMAEMNWALLLFPSNIKPSTKRESIREIWELSGIHWENGHPLLRDAILAGIGSGGTGFNNHRWRELRYLIELVTNLKQKSASDRSQILSDYDRFLGWLEDVPREGSRQYRHMLRYFLFSDRVERMCTNGERRGVLEAFKVATSREMKAWTDRQLDDALLVLRHRLEGEFPGQILDFYRPPLVDRWREQKDVLPITDQEPSRRFWVEKTIVKGRPDRELGENALGRAIWSPQLADGGRDIYRHMREVSPGDIVFHFVDNEALTAFSEAAGASGDFTGLAGTEWEGRPAIRIPLTNYQQIVPPINRSDFLQETKYRSLIDQLLATTKGLFFNREHNLNQGSYLTEAPLRLVQIWDDIQRQRTGKPIFAEWDLPLLDAGAKLEEPISSPNPSFTQTGYWWLNANPKIWKISDTPIGQKQTYTSHNDKGNKRQKYKWFQEVKIGDLVVGYVTSPQREIVAICRITKALHQSEHGESIEFEKIEQLSRPIDYDSLQAIPELESSEPLINNQGSLFKLTEQQYETIRSLIDETNVPVTTEIQSYDKARAMKGLFLAESQFDDMLGALKEKKNLVVQGAPGVGKTFVARRLAYALIGSNDPQQIETIQFHQSYSYEDFIQGFRPTPKGHFDLKYGIFHRFCRRAQRDEKDGKPYVFIIDEINRGNLSKIFGELMMLIECDKRGEEHAIPLAYSQSTDETFYIPSNLHLIGMMNTADRSLAMVDYALRRRFRFVTLRPEFSSKAFAEFLIGCGAVRSLVDKITSRMNALNEVISSDTKNLGAGYQIGHSYFCPRDETIPDNAWYIRIVESEIVPLIQEYWFDNEQKVKDQRAALLR